jgi:hypothetical protein
VAITLSALLGACLITFGSLALFAPASLGNFFGGLGMYNSSIHFYEVQYGKSQSIEDLAVLVLKLDEKNDSKKVETYLEKMISLDNFEEYCEKLDKKGNSSLSSSKVFQGKYAVSLVRNNKFDKAVDFAHDFAVRHGGGTDIDGYVKGNPFSAIIAEVGEELTDEQLSKLETAISQYLGGIHSDIVELDIENIKQLIDNN